MLLQQEETSKGKTTVVPYSKPMGDRDLTKPAAPSWLVTFAISSGNINEEVARILTFGLAENKAISLG
jgi:hypothetical protein